MTRITCGLPQINIPLLSENLRESAHSADQNPHHPSSSSCRNRQSNEKLESPKIF